MSEPSRSAKKTASSKAWKRHGPGCRGFLRPAVGAGCAYTTKSMSSELHRYPRMNQMIDLPDQRRSAISAFSVIRLCFLRTLSVHAQEPMHMLPCKRLEKSRVVVRLRSLFERMRAIQLGLKAFALEGRGYRCRWLGSSNPNPGTAPTFHEYAPTQKRTGNVILTADLRVLTSYSIIWGHVLPMAVFRGRAIVANSGMHGASENGVVETSGLGSVSVFGEDSTFNGNPGWRQGSIPTWKPSDYGTKTQGRRGAKYPPPPFTKSCTGAGVGHDVPAYCGLQLGQHGVVFFGIRLPVHSQAAQHPCSSITTAERP